MKLTKLSLVAAMLIGSTAFAIENTKVSGDVKLFYGTMDSDVGTYKSVLGGTKPSFFDSEGAYGNAAANLELTTDLTKGVSAGVKGTYVTTLGLENNLVDNTWSNVHTISDASGSSFASELGGKQLDDAFFLGELWVAGSAFDTTVKVGRQALDTPLAFTETWGIDQNTFEAAVLINQSIPDTTLVATYVGKHNGSSWDPKSTGAPLAPGTLNDINVFGGIEGGAAQAGITSQGGKFNTFGTNGVYVAGLVNNTIKPLTVQAWYYSLQQLATATWFQADLNVGGILAGAQYTEVEVNNSDEDEAFAVMLGYEAKDVATVKVAYSDVDDKGTLGLANVATTTGQSKLYTEMWWAYGNVSATGAESYSLTVEATVAGIDLLAGYYAADINPSAAVDTEVTEIALVASKSFGPLDTSVAFIMDNQKDNVANTDNDTNHIQIYLTYNF
ncbi:hypothetical protein [Sulfurimonas sp.]|uniref:hypothetical protein n=1 Tax=Sulfurimonas sp. TaxID=2022749 RepID=UPI0019FFDA48|nr:hypothetical protein [Sulfurimonas sp.]MBE0514879.1 hypothetical protein [Sulfurimonas sp.]